MTHDDRIPETVVSALRFVHDEGPSELELYDRDDVLYVMHCCGFDDACSWVHDHTDRYFDAVRTILHRSDETARGRPHPL